MHRQGEKNVSAADITFDSDVEVLNLDLPIATLNSKGSLHMKINAERGRGYRTADEKKQEGQPIGLIPVDSIFTPVSRVTYQVENTRGGKVANFDKITYDYTLNGILSQDEDVFFGA